MNNDRTIGGLIFLGSIVSAIAYFWLIFMSPWTILTIQASAFLAVSAVLLIIAWIGYTLATTPPPVPLEDLDLEEEIEEIKENVSES